MCKVSAHALVALCNLSTCLLALQMGMNMIRLWAGAACAREPFYEACDDAGILVWQEFWITGDCNGRGATPVRN